MILGDDSDIWCVDGISEEDTSAIGYFFQGAVYCWCKNNSDRWFTLSDLMGGCNSDWNNTPLQSIFKKHESKERSIAKIETAKDAGSLLKNMIKLDKRFFETKKDSGSRAYKWIEK